MRAICCESLHVNGSILRLLKVLSYHCNNGEPIVLSFAIFQVFGLSVGGSNPTWGMLIKAFILFLLFLGVLALNENEEPITCIILSYWKSRWYWYSGTWLIMSRPNLHFLSSYRILVILMIRKISRNRSNYGSNLSYKTIVLLYPSEIFLTLVLFVCKGHNLDGRI